MPLIDCFLLQEACKPTEWRCVIAHRGCVPHWFVDGMFILQLNGDPPGKIWHCPAQNPGTDLRWRQRRPPVVLHVCLGSSLSGFGHTQCAKSLTTFWSFSTEVTTSRLRMCGCAHGRISYFSPCCDRITEKKPLEGGRAVSAVVVPGPSPRSQTHSWEAKHHAIADQLTLPFSLSPGHQTMHGSAHI